MQCKMQTPLERENRAASTCLISACFIFPFLFLKSWALVNSSSQIQTCQPSPVLLRSCMWKVSRLILGCLQVCTSKLLSGWIWSAAVGSQTGLSLQRWSKESLGKRCWILLLCVQCPSLYMDVYIHHYVMYAYIKYVFFIIMLLYRVKIRRYICLFSRISFHFKKKCQIIFFGYSFYLLSI